MSTILFQMHIMWYESRMLEETLDSVQYALEYSKIPVKVELCFNAQTFIESPEVGVPEDMFILFNSHPIVQQARITMLTNEHGFRNIADWRREVYDPTAKYTVWGESDCLVPKDYFYILSSLDIPNPHVVTLASRKMWDSSWDIVEHKEIVKYQRTGENPYTAPWPLNSADIINLSQLNDFNSKFDIEVEQLSVCKFDGSLLAVSGGIYEKFIPDDMHFIYEDTSAERFFEYKGWPQYVIKTRIKGHNYGHPNKRTNTRATRQDNIYNRYAEESKKVFINFMNTLGR